MGHYDFRCCGCDEWKTPFDKECDCLGKKEKPMNQDYTFKVGDTGKTRGGGDYEVVAVLDKPLEHGETVVALSGGYVEAFDADGLFDIGKSTCPRDLLPPTKRIQGWVNILKHEHGNIRVGDIHPTKEEASRAPSGHVTRLGCIYIDIEEGEGLN